MLYDQEYVSKRSLCTVWKINYSVERMKVERSVKGATAIVKKNYVGNLNFMEEMDEFEIPKEILGDEVDMRSEGEEGV